MKSRITVSSGITIGTQPSEGEIDRFIHEGFHSVVNLSVGEGHGNFRYLSPMEEKSLLVKRGVQYARLPMSIASLDSEQLQRLCEVLRILPKPVYIHGRIGKESLVLAMVHIAIKQNFFDDDIFLDVADLDLEYDDPRLRRYVWSYGEHIVSTRLRRPQLPSAMHH